MIDWIIIDPILRQGYSGERPNIQGVSIDTRTMKSGELYVALRGERFDGHDFLQQASEAGAVMALVDHDMPNAPLPLLVVDDTLQALTEMARLHRAQMPAKFIAITGSCGKTTTRALTSSILSLAGNAIASVGSLNNHIGVPLSLLRVRADHQFVIQEVGTNHPGEIATLTDIVKPDVAVVTMAAPVHVEGLGSIQGVAKEKGSIYQCLADQGVAIINADDAFATLWHDMAAGSKQVTFSAEHQADVSAHAISVSAQGLMFELCAHGQSRHVDLPLLGRHNAVNALAAAAIAIALGVELDIVVQGLSQAKPEKSRLIVSAGIKGCRVIDDSYNANPVAMRAAIELLADQPERQVLVFGDMGELGSDADRYHKEVGDIAKSHRIHALYCFGDLSRLAAEEFGVGAYFFDNQQALIDQLQNELDDSTVVLVKGSRAMAMDKVAKAIEQKGS